MNTAYVCRPKNQYHEGGIYCSCDPLVVPITDALTEVPEWKKACDEYINFPYKKNQGNIGLGYQACDNITWFERKAA